MNNNPLDVDQQTPTDTSYIIENRNSILLQHGGIASRLTFKECAVMDMNTFLQMELPKMQKSRKKADDSLYVLRDTINNNITLMYDDCVLRYKCESIEEVHIDDLAKYIQTTEMKTFFPGISYPLIGYVEQPGRKDITVYVPPRTFNYMSEKFNGGFFQDTITMPPIWFRVTLNNALTVMGCGIAVVLQNELDPMDTVLHNWILPNVHASGDVCLGSSKLVIPDVQNMKLTEGVCIQMALDQILNSYWNLDLTWDYNYNQVLGKSYQSLPTIDAYEKRIASNKESAASCDILRVLRVLKEPTGYLKLNWPKARFTAKEFLMRGRK